MNAIAMYETGEPDPGVGWMLALRAGDDSAFERIIDHYQEMVLNLIFKFMGTRKLAEDMAQEVFLRVFRARMSYRPEARFRTWIYRIVFNLCVNQTKSNRRRRTASLHDPRAEDADALARVEDGRCEDPVLRMQRAELSERIRDIVQSLPESQRMALILNKYEGQSYKQIAETIDSTEKAVKSLLARAREKIKERLLPYIEEGVS